jgi:hypothetical protein
VASAATNVEERSGTGSVGKGMLRNLRLASALLALCVGPCWSVAAQNAALPTTPALPPPPEELVLAVGETIPVIVNGELLRLEVTGEAFGPPVINPAVAERLWLVPESRRGWRFGPVVVDGYTADAAVDFGGGPAAMAIAWADRPASTIADGVIGVHHLPHARVTFALSRAVPGESMHRLALRRVGGGNARLGTEVTVGKKRLMMIFVPERAENLVTAPTANFIATHQEGGFEPGSDGIAVMDFGVERPTRMMRIAEPIPLGEFAVERFAVRVEDYGEPTRVGEIGENDPRFEKGRILVSRRKGRGKPDLLTRIGRDQIAHCSSLTYDLAGSEIRLSCTEPAASE